MKLRYKIAEISFATDLTDIDADIIALGVLFLAENDEEGMAVLILNPAPEHEDMDEYTLSMLKEYPALVLAQLKWLLKKNPDISINDLLNRFQESMRNSVYVSDISSGEHTVNEKVAGWAPEKRVVASALEVGSVSIARLETPANVSVQPMLWSHPSARHRARA